MQIDVDECTTNEHDCDLHEVCVNNVGGYTCQCKEGFERGNQGRSCIKKGKIIFPFSCWNVCRNERVKS